MAAPPGRNPRQLSLVSTSQVGQACLELVSALGGLATALVLFQSLEALAELARLRVLQSLADIVACTGGLGIAQAAAAAAIGGGWQAGMVVGAWGPAVRACYRVRADGPSLLHQA